MATKPIIGLDLDDALIDKTGALRERLTEVFGKQAPFGNVNDPRYWSDHFGLSQEAAVGFVLAHELEVPAVKLSPHVAEVIQRLSCHYRLHIITSRAARIVGRVTREAVEKMPVSHLFEDLHFTENPYFNYGMPTKGEMCRRLGAVAHVDDSVSQIADVVPQAHGILVGENPWQVLPQGLTPSSHVPNWLQAEEVLMGLL